MFLGLLAYDWFRVLIWFDHMGLRVATLVNLSFIGGDLADERAARWIGHSGRARMYPRRPAPLRDLGAAADPLLHPARRRVGPGLGRGRADAGRRTQPAAAGRRRADRLRPCARLALLVAVVVRCAGARARRRRSGRGGSPAWSPDRRFASRQRHLHAGGSAPTAAASAAAGASGDRAARARPDPALGRPAAARRQIRLPARAAGPDSARPCWSLGWQPLRHAGATFAVEQPSADHAAPRQRP